jgi:uncharacterized protein (DUF1800 family)
VTEHNGEPTPDIPAQDLPTATAGSSRRTALKVAIGTGAAVVSGSLAQPANAAARSSWGAAPKATPRRVTRWSSPTSRVANPLTAPAPTITINGSLPTYPLPTGPAVSNQVGTDPYWHLLRRATYGPTPASLVDLRSRGASAWLDRQLAPQTIDDSVCDAFLTSYPSLQKTVAQLRTSMTLGGWTAMFELATAKVTRSVFSQRQLFEVMVEFWHDHLHVACPSSEVWDVMTGYDRDVIRPLALGRFADLLLASAQHPAMLRYLSNYQSSTATLNENYGRELLELHTVGVESGYTQPMVVDSARIMTGWTVNPQGQYTYTSNWHYVGPVNVLGFSSTNPSTAAGVTVAHQYLDYLAHHPATARHIAYKLAVRFVSDFPSATLVDSLASVYLANDTAIVPVLKALFTSTEFLNSYGQKLKRPFEDTTATMRTLGLALTPTGNSTSLSGIYWMLQNMAHQPMAWHPPNGFPDTAEAWSSTGGVLGRWNMHIAVLEAWWNGNGYTTPDPATLVGTPTPTTLPALIDILSNRLLGVTLSTSTRNALLAYLTSSGTTTVANALRYRMKDLCALILNSPAGAQR